MNAYEDTNRKKKPDSWGVFRVVEIFLENLKKLHSSCNN